jgi:hypothetical protein
VSLKHTSRGWRERGAVRVRVAERTSIWRNGRCWSSGDTLILSRADARNLLRREMVEEVKG